MYKPTKEMLDVVVTTLRGLDLSAASQYVSGQLLIDAADAIVWLRNELKNCRDELCLRCGQYRQAHLGACDGCRYKDV